MPSTPSRVRPSGARSPAAGRGRAFSLVELLLVLAIIVVVTAVTLPSFVRSIRGNRLRAAARTVVTSGRYARTMAILEQREMTLAFDLDRGVVSVWEAGWSTNRLPVTGAEDAAEPSPAAEEDATAATNVAAAGKGPAIERVDKVLDRVRIERVEFEGDEEPVTKGHCLIPYYSNGTCRPYTVRVVDENEAAVTVDVDALSGVETTMEKEGALE